MHQEVIYLHYMRPAFFFIPCRKKGKRYNIIKIFIQAHKCVCTPVKKFGCSDHSVETESKKSSSMMQGENRSICPKIHQECA